MTESAPEKLELKRKKEYVTAALRLKRERGELTGDQIAQLDAIGFSWIPKGKAVVGVTDLATICPDLAAQWHPTRNGRLTPRDVVAGSNKKVWWQCEKGHEWEAIIVSRSKGAGCPYCSNKAVLPGCNDLATANPALAAQWHPTRNGSLAPQDVMAGSHKKVWWQCEKGHEWEANIVNRSKGIGCPYCSGKKAISGVNDLATVNPDLSAEWHPTRNGGLTPQDVMAGSGKKVWWQCEKGHEWEATVNHRTRGSGCPYCSGKRILPGFNDLATTHPGLSAQWHPTRNGDLTPQNVTSGSSRKIWWLGPCGHEWEATVANRSKGNGCPTCYRNSCKKEDVQR